MACVLDAENSSNALKRRKNLSSTNMQINESDYYNQSPVSEGKTRRLSLTILPAEERLMDDEGLRSLVSGKLYQIIDGINNNYDYTYSNNYINDNNNNGNSKNNDDNNNNNNNNDDDNDNDNDNNNNNYNNDNNNNNNNDNNNQFI